VLQNNKLSDHTTYQHKTTERTFVKLIFEFCTIILQSTVQKTYNEPSDFGSITVSARAPFVFQNIQTGSAGLTQLPTQWSPADHFPEQKRPGRQV
jgi:nucleoid DNA-binding protein